MDELAQAQENLKKALEIWNRASNEMGLGKDDKESMLIVLIEESTNNECELVR